MNQYSVIKGVGYTLAITPDMVLHNGTTQTVERERNNESEYLKNITSHIRSYEDAVNYIPNQIYIGNEKPELLDEMEFPWYDKKFDGSEKGKFGDIIPEDEFYGLLQICDVFELVKLEEKFSCEVKAKMEKSILGEERASVLDKNGGTSVENLEELVKEEAAAPLYFEGKLVGAIKRAHEIDVNLSAHVMTENLVAKASSVLSILYMLKNNSIEPAEIEYVIDCCEEACGDMNQRGGGNFAKAAAETAGLKNATGSDTRGFCAAPAHAIVQAASLVRAGTYKSVIVTGGGCSAKLGMNGKDHVKKNIPILEDAIAGFAVLITENDGVSPIIRNDVVGRHTVGTGSSPQDVLTSLVTSPLESVGLTLKDVDKYAPELQNSDITKPAGAGDVAAANYKMIAALGVKKGQLDRKDINDFVIQHGMKGWAPTQGHIPSGVPYLGFAREDLMAGKIKRIMIIGKGSLFLGRLTNLFDGISFLIESNPGIEEKKETYNETEIKEIIANAMLKLANEILSE
ncbi:MAG: ketoacyl-ACP synthase III family protein [Peptostreptococcaceae bacterium]|nr:ketoacyl-ACP synthase III family protein [Peptostreptococcaceae bacterium]